MRTYYYYELDGDTFKFYEKHDFNVSVIEFSAKKISYRNIDVIIPEDLESVKYWDYNKMINAVIFKK